MVENTTQEDILRLFSSGDDAVKTYEEILEGLKDKNLEEATLKTSLVNLVSLGKLGNKLFSTKSVYWLTSQFTTTQKATPIQRVSGERKGIRRPFVSPVLPSAKKICLQDDKIKPAAGASSSSSSSRSILLERRQLQEKIKEQEVMLQQLKNADETAKSGELDRLIKKWRTVSQQAAEQLLEKAQGVPPPSLGEMLHHLHVDPELIHYNEEDETFY